MCQAEQGQAHVSLSIDRHDDPRSKGQVGGPKGLEAHRKVQVIWAGERARRTLLDAHGRQVTLDHPTLWAGVTYTVAVCVSASDASDPGLGMGAAILWENLQNGG